MLDLNELLRHVVEREGSDLHVKVGSPPYVRVDGRLELTQFAQVGPQDCAEVAEQIMPPEKAAEFEARGESDFALGVAGLGRFRVNVFRQRGSVGLVFRRVLPGTPSIDELNLPPIVRTFAEETQGLVLVTGPAGSGKTTTVAAMLDHINETKTVNIVTVEDPIEILHPDKNSIVNQREVGSDIGGYSDAMRRVLRQDPDVIFIGDLPDPESVRGAMTAAETGRLVLSTMNTIDVGETLARLVEFFPVHQQKQIRTTLASSLRGVFCQRLLDRADGNGRVPAAEILVPTPRVVDCLRSGDLDDLEHIMTSGEYYGMQTFDQSLFSLCRDGYVSFREAVAVAAHPTDFEIALQKAGVSTSY